MIIPFKKYQGAGNDFVMVDQRNQSYALSSDDISKLCDRRFGIGADGLILLQNHPEHDFQMVYYNSDGRESTMCGNGGRCIVRFAHDLQVVKNQTNFVAIDGLHQANVEKEVISLEMIPVNSIGDFSDHVFLNTGSPHHVVFVENVDVVNVEEEGRKIRYGAPYFEEGTNVNFVSVNENGSLRIRTYERGVEAETLACGTGVTAAALAAFYKGLVKNTTVDVSALGGELKVKFEPKNETQKFENIWLIGPAEFVFEGQIEI